MKLSKSIIAFLIKYLYRIRLSPAILIVMIVLSIISGILFESLVALYKQKTIYPKLELSVDTFHYFLKTTINNSIARITVATPVSSSQLETFYITIDGEDLSTLNADPRRGKEKYYKAYLKIGKNGSVKSIKLRLRGDNPFHYMYKQKSLRLKMNKKDLYQMQRKINLVNPPRMEGYVLDSVSYELARDLGLISPDFYPVRTFINGQYMGVYTFLSHVDESLLRKNKRMPGSIYAGDGAKITEGMSELWFKQSNWKKIAARNAEQKNNREDILYFLEAATKFSNIEFNTFVNSMINKDKYYNYMALDVILGTSHHDYLHNHKIYFDPYLGKFEPIEWDVRYWTATQDKDESLYPMLEMMKLNPVVEYERDKVTYELLNNKMFYDEIHKKIDKYQALVLPDLKADSYRDFAEEGFAGIGYFSKSFSIIDFENSIVKLHEILDSRRKILLKIYQNSKSFYYSKQAKKGLNILFKVQGNSPIQVNLSALFNTPHAMIYRDMNFNGEIDEGDVPLESDHIETLYPGRKKTDAMRNGALKVVKGPFSIINAPLYYSYLVSGENKLPNRAIDAVNVITGQKMLISHEVIEIGEKEADSVHPWLISGENNNKQQMLSGVIEVKNDLIFTEKESVTINAGTKFIMYPGTSVYFYGEVKANGTKVKPISFEAQNAIKPWGSVVLQGQKTSGSYFNYVEFSGGSVTSRNLVHYTAQFNIHGTTDFKVTNCKIGPNYIGDDSMHIAYSKGVVDRCVFYKARSDALDVDISTVTVSNSLFIDSGNDSLDLMTTDARVINNLFINAGDKGISTGEWSTGNYTNNLFYNNLIGIEVKDKSVVRAENLIIINSKDKAINLYNKNLRYDVGGVFTSDKVVLIGNTIMSADKSSKLQVTNVSKKVPSLSDYPFIENVLGVQSGIDSVFELLQRIEQDYE